MIVGLDGDFAKKNYPFPPHIEDVGDAREFSKTFATNFSTASHRIAFDSYYGFTIRRKDGKPAKKYGSACGPYYRVLETCAMCGRVGTERVIMGRSCGFWYRSSLRYKILDKSPCIIPNESKLAWSTKFCKRCWGAIKPLYEETKLLDVAESIIREIELDIRRKKHELNYYRDQRASTNAQTINKQRNKTGRVCAQVKNLQSNCGQRAHDS